MKELTETLKILSTTVGRAISRVMETKARWLEQEAAGPPLPSLE